MKKGSKANLRRYTATADTGRDFISFEFFSNHRAGSKANYNDAQTYYRTRHGYRPRIIRTSLTETF